MRFPRSFVLLLLSIAAALAAVPAWSLDYPETPRHPVIDTYHGAAITDDYRWLENAEDPAVIAWTEQQEALTRSLIDPLPQREFLIKRFGELWRYDDEGVPTRVLDGERIFFWTKKKDDEKWVYNTRVREGAEPRVLLDPNQWDAATTLSGVTPSRDGVYVAYGQAHGGDENPVVRVMVVETGEILPDSLRGWRQNVTGWLPDDSGFFYSARPRQGEVPEGEHQYWHTAWFHRLGTPADQDLKVFSHDEVKEYYHTVSVSEDGTYLVFNRGLFNSNEIYIKKVGTGGEPVPVVTGFDADYSVDIVDGKMLITTDRDAPLYRVFLTDVDTPEPEHWKEFIPEHENDRLSTLAPVDGHIYAVYLHNAYTRVRIYDLEGNFLRELPFPTIGRGTVSGHWSQPEVWVNFSSFNYPSTTFRYDFPTDELAVYHEFPVEVNVDDITVEQVWYASKDGTQVSMFLVHRKDLPLDGNNPVLLTGYGGFNISRTPRFSTSIVVWLESGGVWAEANLRGGGEYGKAWHEAGMRENKQNVFDDFIAAAEWLVDNKYTNPDRLAIYGGSNGGLLVGAATVQRPDLFRVVYCAVPLLDMVNYHTFGLANIWAEEYGSSEDPAQFTYLRAYSPYHNVADGADYPAFLVTGSENDARVDPLHARKMAARMQAADPDGEPILLLVRKASGHGGGTTISTQIEQTADIWAFLMDRLGMETPR